MKSKLFLIKLQYLGLRYHGAQKQLGFETIQSRLEAVLFKHISPLNLTIKWSSRTDAMVSSLESYCLLILDSEKYFDINFINNQLPPDIKILSMSPVKEGFNLQDIARQKIYHYYFSYGQEKQHPFTAPFMTHIKENLDLEKMKLGAKLFLGRNNFKNYCYKPKENKTFESFNREIISCDIFENNHLSASFFPSKSFYLMVEGQAFMRGQIRLMIGALFRVGMGSLSLDDLERSLKNEDPHFIKWMAPASGLILERTCLALPDGESLP